MSFADWKTPLKPAEYAETQLIDAILENHFPIGTSLPAERELAAQLGVTRPTLREALQRLARDGWVEIRQGRPTRVRDYWHEGNLAVLGSIARRSEHIPTDFVTNLLSVRQVMAPEYMRLAVARAPEVVVELLKTHTGLTEDAPAFAAYDWKLHHSLTIASGNPVYTLILNGFCDLYYSMACIYFKSAQARASSRAFYVDFLAAAEARDPAVAEEIVRRVMGDSLSLWQSAINESGGAI